MIFLVSYDIPSSKLGDRRRAALAKKLEGWGLRVQFSIFEVELDPQKLPLMIADLQDTIDATEDSVRVYPLCGTCMSRMTRLGVEAVVERAPVLIW